MRRSLLILTLVMATGCDDWSAVERAPIPRLVVEPPTAPVVGGIGVTTTLSLAVYNNGAVDAELTVDEPILLDTTGTPVSDSISVVPNSAIPTISAGSSLSLSFDVTPDQMVDAGVLQLTVTTEPASWPERLVVEVPIDVVSDWDRDGADHPVAGGDDCDDQDPDIGPNATETWYDGVDQNCDGNDLDADEDGFEISEDCDDGDAGAFPGNEETWYDGVDQDCDGNDADQDLDGHAASVVGGTDCDDTDAMVGPGNPDGGIPGLDDDCDGLIDEDEVQAGDLVISEVMRASTAGDSATWFEVVNVTDRLVYVEGWTVRTDLAESTVRMLDGDSPALLGGTGLVVCADSEVSTALGVPCGAVLDPWPSPVPSADIIELSAGDTMVDSVRWNAAWPGDLGISMSLDRRALDHVLNDSQTYWCGATRDWGADDLGTPGRVNDQCE